MIALGEAMQQATQSQTPDPAALRAQIREQVRQQVQAAQAQARAAQEQARQAVREAEQAQHGQTAPPAPPGPIPGVPDAPPIPQIPGTQPPFEFPYGMRTTIEHVAIEFFVMIVAIFFVVPIARAFARRIDKKPVASPLDQGLTEQLKRIENSVDSMAIEIERISESQRYMVRLQSDRGASAALPSQETAG
ncbi:MAG TPA: hypothetical protein VL157_04710 [Gemmatimonadaceae bacterium]|jgi:hypothetical protein|nr:hypothetical protein [Gemmatimonadaceae bacterium]